MMALLDVIGSRLGVTIQFRQSGMGGGGMVGCAVPSLEPSIREIGRCVCVLLAALLGGVIANAIFGCGRIRLEKLDTDPPATSEISGRRQRSPAVVVPAASVLILALGWFASRSVPGLWAGATFLSTCGLLGIAILGVAGAQGKWRQAWLGAAVFGVGYMTLAFGRSLDKETWPALPTDHLLYAVRGWFPPLASGFSTGSDGITSANARIHEALEQAVPMRFPQETPLEDVLKYIQSATRGPDDKRIPIYVEPVGLQEAEKSMTSTVAIELEGVALKTSLRLCLKQLCLSYSVRDGLLLITSEESLTMPIYQDPFLIVGHCLLALLAAGFGGSAAPRVWFGPAWAARR